jgi:hypothetical protein
MAAIVEPGCAIEEDDLFGAHFKVQGVAILPDECGI